MSSTTAEPVTLLPNLRIEDQLSPSEGLQLRPSQRTSLSGISSSGTSPWTDYARIANSAPSPPRTPHLAKLADVKEILKSLVAVSKVQAGMRPQNPEKEGAPTRCSWGVLHDGFFKTQSTNRRHATQRCRPLLLNRQRRGRAQEQFTNSK